MKGHLVALILFSGMIWAAVLGTVRGVVHDPDHRPMQGAEVVFKSSTSDYMQKVVSDSQGLFETSTLPVGAYIVTVTKPGFAPSAQEIVAASGTSPILHFQLAVGAVQEKVTVSEAALAANPEHVTPTTILDRQEIAETPGADLSNSMSAIVNFVPDAWMTHDQLHVRGGHQVTWEIDGVPIPNTNIASNVGPQIDPKDIDYLEIQRGGYSADSGDRTYALFNVIPRTGFEMNNQGEFSSTIGSFFQTNDQISFGSHTEKFAYYGSFTGNRSDYGLETPGPDVLHDRAWGLSGMATLIYNRDADNQFRFVTSLRGDDYQIPNDPDAQAAGIRDVERERDDVVSFSWIHTFRPGLVLTASPFFHFNRANYDGDPNDTPVSTTQHRSSLYGGAQVSLTAVTKKHSFTAGIFGFGQRDNEFINLIANDGSGTSVGQQQFSLGQLAALYLEDQYKPLTWLTLTGGVRLTYFNGALQETAANPRLGGAIRLPHLNWVLRAFWGTYYQAPPLSTVEGPLVDYAVSQGLGFIPLHGERDQEHQFGVTIPVHGWSFEVNNYHQRAKNYFDHNNIGDSDIFFPLTIDGARLYGWEITARSPRLAGKGEVYVTYANATAEGEGAITGGLTDFSPPSSGYFLLDHDQRNTFHTGFSWRLPRDTSVSGSLYYGSGFTDGSLPYPGHLEPHVTSDFSLGKEIGKDVTLSVTGLNITNRRFLLDNSTTFGGTHYADPRQVYVQLKYRFHF